MSVQSKWILTGLLFIYSTIAFAVSSDALTITADQSDFNYQTQKAYFKGHVKLIQNQNTLLADHVALFFDQKRQLEKAVATGSPATFKYPAPGKQSQPIHGSANEIVYFPKTQLLILTGQAELQQQQNRIKGGKIEFSLANNRLKTEASAQQRTQIIIQDFDQLLETKP